MIQLRVSQVRILCAVSLGFFWLAEVSSAFPNGNIFELRPPRVRVATPEELVASSPLRYTVYGEPVESVIPQEFVLLTPSDALVAVFPVHDYTNPVRTIYEVAGIDVGLDGVTIDFYQFAGGIEPTDSITPPLEQSAVLGNLPAGDYDVTLRYWFLSNEDQLGFDPSIVPEFIPPPPGTIVASPAGAYYTQSNFSFTVIPEPSSWLIAALGVGAIAAFCRRTRRLVA